MRSSLRARNSPPNPQQGASSSSSSSSLSSARPERSTRSHHKSSPAQKSTSPAFFSEDDAPTPIQAGQTPHTRRSTRQVVDDDAGRRDEGVDSHVGEVEDDVTRCICGHQEYPGPPLSTGSAPSSDIAADEAGGLFIQCDKCHVWQHGGCVGIMDESKSPENYFCELCDKKLHNVMTDARGQRYSLYLPLHAPEPKSARKSSVSKDNSSDAKAKKERENISRASVDSIAAKRRSTMNSRQAYDEEETLRRVIEESKGAKEIGPEGVLVAAPESRRGKRSRDDSEDINHEIIKRQRTSSDSPGPLSTSHTASHLADSDDDDSSATRPTASSLKKARSAAAENQRQRELTEREKVREAQRAEAAGRRKARAGRRRGDESETIDDPLQPEATPRLSASQPPSPEASETLAQPSSSHKRGGNHNSNPNSNTNTNNTNNNIKKPLKRGAGRNQHIKDRDFSSRSVSTPHRSKSQPHVQNSSGEEPSLAVVDSKSSSNGVHDIVGPAKARLAKAKAKNGRHQAADGDGPKDRDKDAMSLGDMKKRALLMIEYITKAQTELASEAHSFLGAAASHSTANTTTIKPDFRDLTSREMMDTLTRQIVAWQKEYSPPASVA